MINTTSGGLKIFSLQENLKQGLALVGHISGKNINLPILNNVLIRAEEGKIRLVATNLEIGVISTVRGKIEREGLFTVNSKIISDCINLLPNKKIGLEQKLPPFKFKLSISVNGANIQVICLSCP